MATKKPSQQQYYVTQLQKIETFSINISKLSFLTLILLPKYTFLCLVSTFLSELSYMIVIRLLKKQGLRLSGPEKWYEFMFLVENLMMALHWVVYMRALAIGFFAFNNVIYIMRQNNLFQKIYDCPSNNPKLIPSQERGYMFWFVRSALLTVCFVPEYCFVHWFRYFAAALVLVPAIGHYISKQENTHTLNSRDPKEVARSSNSNDRRSRMDKRISVLESHLFWLERAAIYCSLVYSSKLTLIFAMNNALHMLLSFSREDVVPPEPDYLFWTERAATIFLVAYGLDKTYYSWWIAAILFAFTNFVYFFTPMNELYEFFKHHLENVFLEEFEEDSSASLHNVEIRRLKAKNNDLEKEKDLCARELSELSKETEVMKRLMEERDQWGEIQERLSSAISELNRDKLTLAEKLDKTVELMEEQKRAEEKREEIWRQTLAAEKCQHLRQMREAELAWEETLKRELEKEILECSAETFKYQKQLFRAEKRVSELMVELEQASSSRAKESEDSSLDSELIGQLREENERVSEKYARCNERLVETEAKVAELENQIKERDSFSGVSNEEYERVKKNCEMYMSLLHDHDCEEVIKGVVD